MLEYPTCLDFIDQEKVRDAVFFFSFWFHSSDLTLKDYVTLNQYLSCVVEVNVPVVSPAKICEISNLKHPS